MPADFHTPNTIFQEPQSSIIPHILLYIVQYIALISPQSQYRRVTFNVLIIGLAVYSLTHPHFTNDLTIAQPFNIGWSFYLATLAKLNFSDLVELDYWRVDEPAGAAGKYTAFGYAKTRWAMSLMLNTRGIRWNYEVKNVPSKPKQTKLAFVVSYALKFVKNLLLADLFFQLGIRLLYTTPDGQVGQMNSKYMTMRHKDWRWSFAKAFVFGATPYFAMSMQYAQFAIIAVLFGFTLPDVSFRVLRNGFILLRAIGLAVHVQYYSRYHNHQRFLGTILAPATAPCKYRPHKSRLSVDDIDAVPIH